MATLVLQAAGSAIGSMLGGPIGAVIGQTLGAVGGAMIDRSLFGAKPASTEGPRLASLTVTSSSEGAPVPKVYGRARIGGQVIWATRFEEVATVARQGAAGGKGGGPRATSTTYSYFASFAVALCEGPVAMVRRVWADGKEIDKNRFVIRFHSGAETQEPDPLILAKEGASGAPAYRGLAYLVFERMPLAEFGNRLPQLAFEVVRPISDLAQILRGVDLIPGAGEFAYAPELITASSDPGVSAAQNRHQLVSGTDVGQSLDALQAVCPNVRSAALVVSWFGDDLRAGQCSVAPRVDTKERATQGDAWSVAGLTRDDARLVSSSNGGAAYGGSPSDASVIALIRDLKTRGLSVVFYPFVMMDVPAENGLPDPWSGAPSQPAYPWRGRITCDPAPGRAGSVDATSAAAEQVARFFGSAEPGAGEWSYRRMILHYARLCAEAGGVDAFLLGSELVGLTRLRSAPGVYPAVAQLATLAADVRAILGTATKLSYSADWSEYGAHVLSGGAEVRFPLDPLWASLDVDFVSLDAYWPLSDWRDGRDHADARISPLASDRAYLASRLRSGEDFDFYYESEAARRAQHRSPITDGAYGKPWVFRAKDLAGWWSQPHVERVNGVEASNATAWSPGSKPVWLAEIGCPAADRGANQPNVFSDPKSSESARPHFSRGARDDAMQVATLEAMLLHYDPASPVFAEANNPVSPITGARMVDPANIHVWAWDARPFPAFPQLAALWRDAANWRTGHWITGRVEGAPLQALVRAILRDFGLPDSMIGVMRLEGMVDGYVVERPMSARAALEPLLSLFLADLRVSSGRVDALLRGSGDGLALAPDDLVEPKEGAPLTLERRQDSDLPREIVVAFQDGDADYRRAAIASRRLEGASLRQNHGETGLVLHRGEALLRAELMLNDLWRGRDSAEFSLSLRHVALEPGDAVRLDTGAGEKSFVVEQVTRGDVLRVKARGFDAGLIDATAPDSPAPAMEAPRFAGPPHVEILGLASDRDGAATLAHAAVFAEPWPGAVAIWRDTGGVFDLLRVVERSAVIGRALSVFPAGCVGRFDDASSLVVRLSGGALRSASDREVLGGANLCAVAGPDGAWEICAFARAELVGARTWRLSRMLRGLGGETHLARRDLEAGARFVLLDGAVVPLAQGVSALGVALSLRVGPADRDRSDPAYVTVEATPGAKALLPFAPARAVARRENGGVRIAWIRRSRRDADAWEPLDVPLGEDREAYAIDILGGGDVKRSLVASTQTLFYATADELADFGAPQSALSLRIRQISAVAGAGFALETQIAID